LVIIRINYLSVRRSKPALVDDVAALQMASTLIVDGAKIKINLEADDIDNPR
jgi:hypothetical protein